LASTASPPGKAEQIVPPVLEPEQLGVPPLAVEQKDEQMPVEPTMRHVLFLAQSLAPAQVSPGCLFPVGAHTAPFWPK
jgi:hypothetical protein